MRSWRSTVFCVAVLLIALPTDTLADPCQWSSLGLYADLDGYQCHVDLNLYVMTDIHVILKQWHGEDVSEVSFRIENFPEQGPDGIVTANWNTDQVSGDIETGITLIFDPPLDGDTNILHLGTLTLFTIVEGWVPPDHYATIADASWMDVNYQEAWVYEQGIFFNYTGEGSGCPLWDVYLPWVKARDFDPPTHTAVQGIFHFSFTMESYYCNPFPEEREYTGIVCVQGEPIHEFSGRGTETHSFMLSTADVPPGDYMLVDVQAIGSQGGETFCMLAYLVDEIIAARLTNLSAVKSIYR